MQSEGTVNVSDSLRTDAIYSALKSCIKHALLHILGYALECFLAPGNDNRGSPVFASQN